MSPLPVSGDAGGAKADIQKIWSSVPHVTWVGELSGSPEPYSITVNGDSVISEKLVINNYDDSIHIRIPLHYGKSNLIVIKDGNSVIYRTDFFFAFSFEGILVPEEYMITPFHSERNESPCRTCHRMDVEMADMMPARPTDSLCYSCHNGEFPELLNQHREAGVSWECLRCHKAEPMETDFSLDGPVKYAMAEGARVAPLCYRCHINKEKEHSEFKYVHGPVAMQGCNMCHNPHGSNNKRLLQKEISTLCVECHRLQEMVEKPHLHAPLVKSGCTACHDPHGSNSPFFLPSDIIGTCFSCHPNIREKGKNHPITGHPVYAEQDPLVEDREFTCVSCHNPHSSEHDRLLAEEELMMLCVRCHPRFK